MKKTVVCLAVILSVVMATLIPVSAADAIALPDYFSYDTSDPVQRYTDGALGGVFTSQEEAFAELNLTPLTNIKFIDGTPMDNFWQPDENTKIYETVDLIFDLNKETKLCYSGQAKAIAEFTEPVTINGIVVTTGTDSPKRSPAEWAIFVSSDGVEWTELMHSDESFLIDWHHHYSSGTALEPLNNVKYVFVQATEAQVEGGPIQIADIIFCGTVEEVIEEPVVEEPVVEEPVVEEVVEEIVEAPVVVAPQTFDAVIIASAAAVVSLIGSAVSKKRR